MRPDYRTRPEARMNCIPSLHIWRPLLLAALCAACNAQVGEPPADPLTYRIDYEIRPDRRNGSVNVSLRLSQQRSLLRELRMRPDARVREFAGDGTVEVSDDRVTWQPPVRGGVLTWVVDVSHPRNGSGYDAWLGPDWGMFRAEDVIPRAATRTRKGARSETWLAVGVPADWSAVTEYYDNRGRYRVNNRSRRFDQPTGWIAVGRLGVRRETIAGVRVAIAGPVDAGIRRMDMLALLNWTLPELDRLVSKLPRRLTIFSAGEPMWRGGLSAPQSLFVHADRPLISENATSTLLHEVMHVVLDFEVTAGNDWIVEGLAEYYSLQLLRRSGTISARRYEEALRDLANWADEADALCSASSGGPTTALAVTVLNSLDREIADATAAESSLDDVVAILLNLDETVSVDTFVQIAADIIGAEPDALHIDNLPGCRNIQPASNLR